MSTSAAAKIAKLPDILKSAKVLYDAGLIKDKPAHYIRRYVAMNPDINEIISALSPPGGQNESGD
ncbi:MAG: hypothetical protein KAS32_24110 [Candidatus Peribacteraceae bacterium]|nr:hypothetical protein [Candidatus Peribacteraceae bacterium]